MRALRRISGKPVVGIAPTRRRQEQNLHGLVSRELACVCRAASFRQRRTHALGSRCDSRDFGPLRLILHAVPGPARRGRALALVLSATCSLLCLFLSLLLDPRCTGTTLALQGPPTAVKKGGGKVSTGPGPMSSHGTGWTSTHGFVVWIRTAGHVQEHERVMSC